jgi:hypothetical protein
MILLQQLFAMNLFTMPAVSVTAGQRAGEMRTWLIEARDVVSHIPVKATDVRNSADNRPELHATSLLAECAGGR